MSITQQYFKVKTWANATLPAKMVTTSASVTPGDKWTCTTCSREMLRSQRKDHQAGRAHINRVKQMPSADAVPEPPLQAATGKKGSSQASTEKNPSQTSTTATAKKQDPIPTPEKKTRQLNPGGAGSKNRKLKGLISQPPKPPSHSTGVFIPSGRSRYPIFHGNYDDYFEKGDDFGLCDKDCGWCGHCMDNADI